MEHGTYDGTLGSAQGGLTVGLGTFPARARLDGRAAVLLNPVIVNAESSLTLVGSATFAALTVNSGTVDSGGFSQTLSGALTLTGSASFTAADLTSTSTGEPKIINLAPDATVTVDTLGSESTSGQNFICRGEGTLQVRTLLATDSLEIAGSTLRQDGILPALSTTKGAVLLANGRLTGKGRVRAVSTTAAGSTIAPGQGIGTLSVAGNFVLTPQTKLEIELGGLTAGTRHDQLILQGTTADFSNAGLSLSLASGFSPVPGQAFTIVNKTSSGPLTNTFAAKPEGHTFLAAGRNWTISYTGGNGNDITLTAGILVIDLAINTFSLTPNPSGGPGRRVLATISGGVGAANATVQLQGSNNLRNWTTLTTTTASTSGFATIDTVDSLAGVRRFYRCVIP